MVVHMSFTFCLFHFLFLGRNVKHRLASDKLFSIRVPLVLEATLSQTFFYQSGDFYSNLMPNFNYSIRVLDTTISDFISSPILLLGISLK